MGSTEAARRAGMTEAARAIRRMATDAIAMTPGSTRIDLVEHRAKQAGGEDGDKDAGGATSKPELDAGGKDETHDARALRAECHADSHLMRAEGSREGDNAIDAEDGEQDGGGGEGGDQGSVEAAGGLALLRRFHPWIRPG